MSLGKLVNDKGLIQKNFVLFNNSYSKMVEYRKISNVPMWMITSKVIELGLKQLEETGIKQEDFKDIIGDSISFKPFSTKNTDNRS
jgi:hypothetical protein